MITVHGMTIDFAALDLRSALDFAILVEEDAQLRYERLARQLGDDAGGAGAVFRSMIATEGEHRARLVEHRAALFREAPPRIEVSALDVAVEGPDGDDDLPATAHEALRLAMAGEQRAHDFFARAIPFLRDPAAREFFAELQQEELEHRDLLAARLAALGPEPRGERASPARSQPLPEPPPADAPELRAILPRFDAATRAIAAGVLVHGLRRREVADALGVSPGTVERKWQGFLRAARQHLALGLAAAALAGCAGPGGAPSPGAPAFVELPAARALPDRLAPPPDAPSARSEVSARVHAHVAARMPGRDGVTRRRIARAVLAEAERAALDPLLVLALIHVESSFDPEVVSDAGAVGLMQLREPTFRRELERSGLAVGDPTDPVTNVRAGVRYLRRLVDAFGGVDVALMAYNAGPGRIRAHLRQGAIPERFQSYPRKVRQELQRLRRGADAAGHTIARGPGALPRTG